MDPNLRWRLDYLTARRHDDIPCNDSGYSTKMFSNSQGPSPSLSSKYTYYKITTFTIIIIQITYVNMHFLYYLNNFLFINILIFFLNLNIKIIVNDLLIILHNNI